jgi:hypothetical protein
MPIQTNRRIFMKSAGALAGAAVLPGSPIASLFAKTDRPQRFKVGFGPATDGTLDSFWMRMRALSEVGFHNIEVDKGVVKIAEN